MLLKLFANGEKCMNIKLITKVLGAITCAFLLSATSNAATCGKITIADMNWPSASLMAHVDKAMLEAMGCEVELVVGATMTTWASMDATGEPDVAPEVWANAMATLVDSAVGAGRIHIGNAAPMSGLGEGWWITPYTLDANPELTTVEAVIARPDLFPDKEDPSKGFFMGCPAGWGCQLSSQSLFKAHGMAEKGWILGDPGTSAGLNGSIAKASEQGENWFGYYWSPTTFLAKYDLRPVDLGPFAGTENWDCVILGADNCADPQPSGWTVSRVNTMLSENFSYHGPTEANAYFAARVYPFSVLNSILVWSDENQATGSDSATHFLANHGDTWKAWVDADVAAEVEAAL